jgi:hypothetical protein
MSMSRVLGEARFGFGTVRDEPLGDVGSLCPLIVGWLLLLMFAIKTASEPQAVLGDDRRHPV